MGLSKAHELTAMPRQPRLEELKGTEVKNGVRFTYDAACAGGGQVRETGGRVHFL